jgi:flagellar FliJ protein
MPSNLHTLIRLYKYKVDEKRRTLSELFGEIASLEKKDNHLASEIISEQEATKSAPDNVGMFYGEYAEEAFSKREKIKEQIISLEEKIALAQEAMRIEFKEMKVFETTQTSRDQAEALELVKEAQKILDELSQEVHRRKARARDE